MNNTFSFHRIIPLFRIDWIEQKKSILLAFASVIAIVIVYVWMSKSSIEKDNISKQQMLYVFGMVGTLAYFCRYAGKKVHDPKGPYLTIPASTLEKYCVLLLEGLLFFLFFHFLFWGSLYICSILFPFYPIIRIQAIYDTTAPIKEMSLFLALLLFLAHLSFRKFALLITIAGLFLLGASYAGITSLLIHHVDYFNNMPPFMFNPLNGTGEFIAANLKDVIYTVIPILLYISYLKLKEKEVR